jgi:glyoxylase-like metal-dependent hydrolase (beta-lactamase superfamily II)
MHRDIKHCIITHLDFDHIGGLADFPDAAVHISGEEYKSYKRGNPRFLPSPV